MSVAAIEKVTVRFRHRRGGNTAAGLDYTWSEWQVVSGRRVISRHDFEHQAIEAAEKRRLELLERSGVVGNMERFVVKKLLPEDGVGYGVYDTKRFSKDELVARYLSGPADDGDQVARYLADLDAKDRNEGIE